MTDTVISFNVPQEILFSLNESKTEFENRTKLFTALFLYREHKLSIGKAALLSGLSLYEFISEAGKHNVDVINYPAEDLDKELEILDI